MDVLESTDPWPSQRTMRREQQRDQGASGVGGHHGVDHGTSPSHQAGQRLQQAHTVAWLVEVCQGKRSQAARRLGISRNTLYRKPGRRAAAAA